MDDKKLTHILNEIANEEVPEMDLWPAIKQQVNRNANSRSRLMFSVSRLAAVFALLLVSVVAYAVYQSQTRDAGLDEAERAGLITELNETQVIDDVSLTLEWAYADAHRIAISFSTAMEVTDPMMGVSPIVITLTDDNGLELPTIFGGGGGGGGGGCAGDDCDTVPQTFTMIMDAVNNFDASVIEGSPDELSLHLEILLSNQPVMHQSGMGGGGGGGSMPPANPEPVIPVTVGPFKFDFTVPFIPATVISMTQTIDVNGVAITLNDVSVTPSMTRLELCLSELEAPWLVEAQLGTGTSTAVMPVFGAVQINTQTNPCADMAFSIPYDGTEDQFTLTIDRLKSDVILEPERLEKFKAVFEDNNVTIHMPDNLEDGFGFGIKEVPPGVDMQKIVDEANSYLHDYIEGPWQFTINIP